MRGCLGLEVKVAGPGELWVEVYESVPRHPVAGGANPPGLTRAVLVRRESVPEKDWMAPYREQAQPFAVGRRLLLDPREPQPLAQAPGERIWLRLPARSAFGTGSHESTRLVLELLETMELAGRRVLDVGTGTGVLAFAARRFGAAAAVALDNDVIAPLHAALNARLNDVQASIFAGTLAALAPRADFDVALVNMIPEQILPELDSLLAHLRPGAEVIFSGILRTAGRGFLGRLRASGLRRVASRFAGEWVAYRVRYRPEPR